MATKSYLISALVGIFLAGCAQPEPPQTFDTTPHLIRIEGFSPSERAEILRAIGYWNTRGAKLAVGTDRFDKRIVAQPDPRFYLGFPAVTVAGTTTLINLSQMNRAMQVGADFCGIVAHEIGHQLGMDHTAWGVMSSPASWQTRCD